MNKSDILFVAGMAGILAASILILLSLGCAHHHHSNGSVPLPNVTLIRPTHAKEIGRVPENVTDICKVGGAVYFSPYLGYSSGKLYKWDGALHTVNVPGKFESVYRVWFNNGLCFGTEQPPTFIKNFHVVQKYAARGWAVLGNVASNGSMWRGWSYRNQPTHIYHNDQPFPSLGKRIVWWVESYRGCYYAGTSSTTNYKAAYDGKIYCYTNHWTILPTGPIGGVITLKATADGLFAGTVHPQSIWRFTGTWQKWDFSATEEVAKFWADEQGRLFTATTEAGKLHVRQWYKGGWPEVWSISAHSAKWGPQGVCIGNAMIISFRDGDTTKIWKVKYED